VLSLKAPEKYAPALYIESLTHLERINTLISRSYLPYPD